MMRIDDGTNSEFTDGSAIQRVDDKGNVIGGNQEQHLAYFGGDGDGRPNSSRNLGNNSAADDFQDQNYPSLSQT